MDSLDCLRLPGLDSLLASAPNSVPYNFDFEQIKREPILILHSSGSTGLPKPVTMTHGSFAVVDNDRNFPKVPGRLNHDLTTWDFPPGSRLYVPFPPFHLAGFFNNILVPLYTKTVPVCGPPLSLPSGGLVGEILRHENIRGSFLPPTITAEIYHEHDGPELLKSLSVLCYAGGPLTEDIGNELVKHVSLCQFYGSTEVGQVRQLLPNRDTWQYIEFHPSSNHEMQPAEDDACELVIYADKESEDFSALNHNFPGLHEYRTKDLFRPHPSKPGLWKFHARRDDILVLSNGEKLNPIPMETGMTASSGVAGAVVVGQGRARVALLVELQRDHTLGSDPVESLWPLVNQLNASIPSYGRVSRSMIIIADPAKPLARAGKGTVIRKLTVAAYENELNALFDDQSRSKIKHHTLTPTAFSLEDVRRLIHSITCDILDRDDVGERENLYLQGLDSVKALEVVDALKASLAPHSSNSISWVSHQTLFTYPTINDLSVVILQWLNSGRAPEPMDNSVQQIQRVSKIKETLTFYEASLPVRVVYQSTHPTKGLTVVLVGSTGFVGGYLLDMLVQDPRVSRIYCLNRSDKASQRRIGNATDKLVFHRVEFRKPNFGLADDIYLDLKERCNVVLHSAWQVNFVLPLSAFTDSFSGLMNSIQLAASTRNQARLLFLSSIAATGVFGKPGIPKRTVPEAVVDDLDASIGTGYGDSKLIAEHIVRAANARSGVRSSVLRVGQVAPSSKFNEARWPSMDSVKALLLTSKVLHMVPSDLMEVDWLPVDEAAHIVQEIMHYDYADATTDDLHVYNLVNPSRMPWSQLVPSLESWCGGNTVIVPFEDWLANVQARSTDGESKDLPAVQLIPFYELLSKRGELHQYAQEHLLQRSKQALGIGAIDMPILEAWLARLQRTI